MTDTTNDTMTRYWLRQARLARPGTGPLEREARARWLRAERRWRRGNVPSNPSPERAALERGLARAIAVAEREARE